MTLDEEVGKPSERQVTTDQVPFLGRPDRKLCGPSHFEKGIRLLPLQRRIVNGHKLSVFRFPIEQ
jgi:hypothetical protein